MTDVSATPAAASSGPVDAAAAGALLRQLREAQGLHIAALAAAIKVTPAKLEALESGRLGELPDLTFARALAQTVCRALKTDAAPVLARMPGAVASRLERVDEGLNTPMPERGHGLAWGGWTSVSEWAPWRRPVPWLALLLLLAAAAFVLVPRHARDDTAAAPAEAGASAVLAVATGAASAVLAASEALAPVPAASAISAAAAASAQPVPAAMPASAAPAAVAQTATPATGLQLRALQDTWVQVIDAQGRVLAARTFTAGETVSFDAAPPLKLKIGNVAGTELQFQGQAVDLSRFRRDNVATLSLP
ncbi:helix-turn-helix domain-containing protein [Ideonella sp. DXS22W]|uniref:Helix-turn-helix domain-containing protein n=1 Tax=Pseudaquabacterium inlustre TaxID=2984192 RepID=A0ABU9CFB5_9BURK